MTETPATSGRRFTDVYFVALAVVVAAWCYFQFRPEPGPPTYSDERLREMRPVTQKTSGHISSSECAECHEHNHATWFDSYHRTMTQEVRPETVLGDFNNVTLDFRSLGREVHLTKRDGYPWVTFPEPLNFRPATKMKRKEFPLVMSTGSHHIQFYWMPIGSGRTVGILPIGHLIKDNRWIPLGDSFLSPPGVGFDMQTGLWNNRCARCHTTFPDRNSTGTYLQYDTKVAEFGISCEACHGPAANHVAIQRNAKSPLETFDTNLVDTVVNPANLSSKLSTAVCAGCHSIYKATANWQPHYAGKPLGKDRHLLDREAILAKLGELEKVDDPTRTEERTDIDGSTILEGAFWPDGRPRVTGGDYNGLLKTACYTKGQMSCLSCHRMHQSRTDSRPVKEWANDQLKTVALDDQACTQCHSDDDYASPKHTHHAVGSTGSSCYNCHMPYTTYGLLTAIRSHAIFSPNAGDQEATGRPAACNLCHIDKTLAWTADRLHDWYKIPKPNITADDREISLAAATALRGDAAQRALVAYAMGWQPAWDASGTDWIPPYLATLLKDPYSAVRYIAARSLRRHAGYEKFEFDFIAEPPIQEERSQAAMRLWKTRPPSTPGTNQAAVMLKEDGSLNMPRFNKMYSSRDNSNISLVE
jgi:hypothetical protein